MLPKTHRSSSSTTATNVQDDGFAVSADVLAMTAALARSAEVTRAASIAAARLSGTPRPAGRLDTSTSRAALAAAMLPTSDSSAVDTPSQTTSTARLPGSAEAATAVASSLR